MNLIHSCIYPFLLKWFLNVACDADDYWLLWSMYALYVFQKVSDLLGRFDAIQDWHAEVSEDDAVRHSVFVRFHHFLNTLLSIYAEVNFV